MHARSRDFECERGHAFTARAYSVINAGYGCSECKRLYYKHSDEARQRMRDAAAPRIVPLNVIIERLKEDGRGIKIVEDSYTRVSETAKFICPKTSLVWEMSPHRVINLKKDCPCCKSERRKNASLKMWQDANISSKIVEGIRKSVDTPEWRANVSAGNKKVWQDPVVRARRLAGSHSAQAQSKRQKSMKNHWRDPEYRARRAASMNKSDVRQRLSEKAHGWTADMWLKRGITEIYLYIIEFIGTGLFKIGITKNPKRRYKYFPMDVKVLAEFKGSTHAIFDMEKELLRRHKPYRVKGESLLAEFKGGGEVFSKLVGALGN